MSLFFIFFIIVLAGSGAFYYYHYKQQQKTDSQTKPVHKAGTAPVISSMTTKVDTASTYIPAAKPGAPTVAESKAQKQIPQPHPTQPADPPKKYDVSKDVPDATIKTDLIGKKISADWTFNNIGEILTFSKSGTNKISDTKVNYTLFMDLQAASG